MAVNPKDKRPCLLCNLPGVWFNTSEELAAHMRAIHGTAAIEGDGMECDPLGSLEYLACRTLDMIDELADRTVLHANPEQAGKLLQALGQRCKILADRLDARTIRSRGFKL